jgi:hypothetical protein
MLAAFRNVSFVKETPGLSGFKRFDKKVSGLAKVPRGMSISRVIATSNVSADKTTS